MPTRADEPTLFWDAYGRLYEDAELTRPTRLRIIELEGDDWPDDD